MHVLFLFMMAFFALTLENGPLIVVSLVGLVFLHELGHSLVAQRLGIRVLDITFWPLGGMARMKQMPEDARIEGLIAGAGPATNLLLAAIGAAIALPIFSGQLQTVEELQSFSEHPIGMFIGLNLLLGGLNLIPAFRMDGGRMLRAWFARTRDWVSATELAVRVGQSLAFGMLIVGLVTFNCGWLLIAAFVWWIGMQELIAVRLRHGASPFGPGRFSSSGPGGMGGDASWNDRGGTLFDGPPDSLGRLFDALRRNASGASLQDELERQYRDEQSREQAGDDREVEVDGEGPRRPAPEVDPQPDGGRPGQGGFSEEDIRRLEQFKGRLRKPKE